uniref:Uncharacterized protein n=1 Tax=Musa acuminata subsp. malaccensis TaxID=214687 RepID=A0A804HMB2_MUSAM
MNAISLLGLGDYLRVFQNSWIPDAERLLI